ncbi:MAG: sigma-E processing peptidase SpoIIGA [Faecalimonas sp.]|nr:sigma-E processing peptidase SpoIIGA [Faecalimonas sp.]
MYYELYVDVLFLVNFMMDYLLLLLLKKMLKCTATHGRICLGAIAGSLLTCLVVILPIPYAAIKLVLFHVVVNTCMIRAGLKIKDAKTFVKAYVLLYIGSFLLGGLLEVLYPYVRVGALFFAIAIGGYYVVSKLWDFIVSVQRINQYHCNVDLYLGERICQVKGMIDTGNGLVDPISKKPVSILDSEAAKRLVGEVPITRIRYVPYCSIGKKEGLLPTLKIDRMHIYGEKECWVQEPLIGVSEEMISAEGAYEMILNPNLF